MTTPPLDRDPASPTTARRRLATAVGYHESVRGALDRGRLDVLVRDRPARVQHRSGVDVDPQQSRSTLSATALCAPAPDGVERDA